MRRPIRSFRSGLSLGAIMVLAGCQALLGLSDRELSSDGGRDASMTMVDAGPGDASVDAGGQDKQVLCEDYCEAVFSACTGKYRPYADKATCETACAAMPTGDTSEAEPTGNTIACRLHQAEIAALTREPWDHCAPAGPGGGGVCGSNCEGYCQLFERACPSRAVDDCDARCQGLRDLDLETRANFDDSSFDVSANRTGETLQCRLVHASAALLDPDNECPRATLAPRAIQDEPHPCAYAETEEPRCADYCRLNLAACTGAVAVYESEGQCLSSCTAIPPGSGSDYGGQDSIGCRMSHTYNAFDGAATHCPHAGPGGEGVCGADCASYCRLLESACPGEFADTYADSGACFDACLGTEVGPKYSVGSGQEGATLACKLLHVVRAFEQRDECAAAMGAAPCTP